MALPPHVTLDKFLRVAITAIQQNPDLLKADRNSLFAAIVTAAQLGLLPDAQLGEAYFVPYKGKVQLNPGYRGLVKLARQGDIGYVEADYWTDADQVRYTKGDSSALDIAVDWQHPGTPVAFYALAKYRDGSLAGRAVMYREEVDKIRARSQASKGPAWTNDYEEMGKKTAVRRLCKLLPLSTEARNAMRLSELQEEQNRRGHIIEGQVVPDPEDEPEAEAAQTPQQTKPRRRRSALDELPPTSQAPSESRPAASTDSERPDLNVDPETGQIIGDFFGDPPGQGNDE